MTRKQVYDIMKGRPNRRWIGSDTGWRTADSWFLVNGTVMVMFDRNDKVMSVEKNNYGRKRMLEINIRELLGMEQDYEADQRKRCLPDDAIKNPID